MKTRDPKATTQKRINERIAFAATVVGTTQSDGTAKAEVGLLLSEIKRQIELSTPVYDRFPDLPLGRAPGELLRMGRTDEAIELSALIAKTVLQEDGIFPTPEAIERLVSEKFLTPQMIQEVE